VHVARLSAIKNATETGAGRLAWDASLSEGAPHYSQFVVSIAQYGNVSKVEGTPLARVPIFNVRTFANQTSAFSRHELGQLLLGCPAR
jgi:hypothetical protein